MAIGQASIGTPHHDLKLEELGEEPRELVIDLSAHFPALQTNMDISTTP
jgi:hypothetical protein